MKLLFALPFSLGLLGLNACKSDKDSVGPTTILGRWQLTVVECFCAPGLPNEAVEFNANGTVVFYKDGQEESRSTYRFTTGDVSCHPNGGPVLEFSNAPSVYNGKVAYTIEPSKLVLDQGSCLDLARKTYRRD